MNENLFASFITPTMMGFPIVVAIIMFPSILFPSSKRLINNRLHSFQHWLVKLIIKQMMLIHTPKGRTWTLMIVSLIMFIGSNWLILGFLVLGVIMEVFLICVLNYYDEVGVINLDGLGDWLMYEVDDVGVMLEGGIGVAAMYSCATWMMVVAGWSLFAGIFIIIEITRD